MSSNLNENTPVSSITSTNSSNLNVNTTPPVRATPIIIPPTPIDRPAPPLITPTQGSIMLPNINDANQFIINAYDYTERLIRYNPLNEDQIITNYINFIIEYKANQDMNTTYIRTSTINDRLPIDLNLYNANDRNTTIQSSNF